MPTYLIEVVAKQRFELIPEFRVEDMVNHTQSIRGPAALDAHARGFCANIPDLQVEVVEYRPWIDAVDMLARVNDAE